MQPNGVSTPGDSDPFVEHGTCMLDKITGAKNGISKNVDPVIVKLTRDAKGSDARYLDGFRKVYDDHYAAGSGNGKLAIVSLSMTFNLGKFPIIESLLHTLFVELGKIGVLIVVGAGNSGNTVSPDLILAS